MNKQTTFGGITPFLRAHYLERTYFKPFFLNKIIICFVNIFPMQLEYTIYFLSPDPFFYVDPILFLYAEYEEPCLVT